MTEEFTPNKPPLKLLVIGHEGHGKSTLIAALKHVSSLGSAAPPAKGKGAWGRFGAAIGQALSGNAGAQEFAPAPVAAGPQHGQGLDARAFVFFDAPASDIPALIANTAWTGGATFVLIVSVADGPLPQTRDHLQLAKQAGAPSMLVFLNKLDMVDDAEMLELVEIEVRDLLNFTGFSGADSLVIRGSALKALQAGSSQDPWAKTVLELSTSLDGQGDRR